MGLHQELDAVAEPHLGLDCNPVDRLDWRIAEVPVTWIERQSGESRFRVLKWLPAYLRWYGYAFATTFLRRPPRTVTLKEPRR